MEKTRTDILIEKSKKNYTKYENVQKQPVIEQKKTLWQKVKAFFGR